ncbi:MAG: hypothetical protein WA690_03135 [Candidatus Acidiferrales bacterium]
MAKKMCANCGAVMEGGANPKCSAGGAHRLDRVAYERAVEAERKKTEAKQ